MFYDMNGSFSSESWLGSCPSVAGGALLMGGRSSFTPSCFSEAVRVAGVTNCVLWTRSATSYGFNALFRLECAPLCLYAAFLNLLHHNAPSVIKTMGAAKFTNRYYSDLAQVIY